MSAAIFDYSDMSRASNRAKTVADRMDAYADDLQRRISEHLDNYTGAKTANIYGAERAITQKIHFMEGRSADLKQFSERLDALVDYCKQSDQQVSSLISRLTGDFKTRNDISVNPVWEALCYLGVASGNSTDLGRFLGDLLDKGGNALGEAWDRIEFWYEYDGGKYYLTENLAAALAIAASVASVLAAIGTILAGGPALAIAAAVVGIAAGLFAIGNGVCNIINNCRAGRQAAEDPGQAKRTNDINTGADWLRTTDNQALHNLATGLDITETALGVASLVLGGTELVKKGYTWLSKKPNLDIETLTFSQIKQGLSNGNWKTMIGDRWSEIKNGASNVFSTLRSGDSTQIKALLKNSLHAYKTSVMADHIEAWDNIKAIDFSDIDKLGKGLDGIKHFTELMDGIANDTIYTMVSNLGLNPIATGTHDNAINLGELVDFGKSTIDSGAEIKEILTPDELKKITKRMHDLRCAVPAG